MTTVTRRRVLKGRLARATTFGLLALAAALCSAPEARAQWAPNGNNINNTNPGNVGVGTAAPEQSLHVNAGSEILSTGLGAGFKFRDRGSASNSDDWVWYSSGNVARFWRAGIGDLLGFNPSGFLGVGTTSPLARLDVMGAANVWDGKRYAVAAGFMAPGSLTVGSTAANFGGGSTWTANTAGLLLEAADNTEIAVHDAGERVASLMYFEGGAVNRMTIGRNMGWGGVGAVSINGNVGLGTTTPGVKLAVNGPGVNVYNTDAWIENNMHAQGNEPLQQGGGRGRMRMGTAWGYSGLYADLSSLSTANDLVLGASSGTVRVGPGSSTAQSLIVPNGNLGVGTAAPGFRLDVQGGAVNASGGLCIAGDCKTSWGQIGGQWTTSGSNLLYNSGRVGIGTAPTSTLDVMGAANIWGGSRYAVSSGHMAPGSLTVGNTAANFGGGSNWTTNTAGLLLEAADNTEIAVHDAGHRIASLMYFEGGAVNRMTIGRNMGWGGVSTVAMNGRVGIGTATPQEALEVVGNVNVTGNISAKYQDVAEWVPSTQALTAGTVVALDTARANHVVASASAYDTRVAGVISAQPGIALGERGEGKVLVATTGRVRIKVNAARAPIQIGDLLVTSDVAGVAMKSEPIAIGGRQLHAPGTIIGKALEPLDKGTGEILVLLSLQ